MEGDFPAPIGRRGEEGRRTRPSAKTMGVGIVVLVRVQSGCRGRHTGKHMACGVPCTAIIEDERDGGEEDVEIVLSWGEERRDSTCETFDMASGLHKDSWPMAVAVVECHEETIWGWISFFAATKEKLMVLEPSSIQDMPTGGGDCNPRKSEQWAQ